MGIVARNSSAWLQGVVKLVGENRPWSEVYWEAAQDWVDKEAAAALLEDTKSSVMAQKQAELGDIPVNRAEQVVKSGSFWKEHVHKIVEARKAANLAKVKLEYIKMRHMEHQSEEANHRAGSRL